MIIVLSGEIATGKTTLAQGLMLPVLKLREVIEERIPQMDLLDRQHLQAAGEQLDKDHGILALFGHRVIP